MHPHPLSDGAVEAPRTTLRRDTRSRVTAGRYRAAASAAASPGLRTRRPPGQPAPEPTERPAAEPTGEPSPPHSGPETGRRTGTPAPPAFVHHGAGVVVGSAVTATAAVVTFDLTVTGRLSMFFDLCFILVGLAAALVVRRSGLFAVGVLPPLLLGAVVALLAVVAPYALTSSHLAFVSTWLTGLAHHGAALASAHLVVLTIVGLRAAQRRAPTA